MVKTKSKQSLNNNFDSCGYAKNMLIKNYIGKELYESQSKEIRYIMLKDAMQHFRQDMEIKYGSLGNYWKANLKRKGYKNIGEYFNELARRKGFKSFYTLTKRRIKAKNKCSIDEYQDKLAKKKGYKSKYDAELQKAKEKGIKTRTQLLDERARRQGYKNNYDKNIKKGWVKPKNSKLNNGNDGIPSKPKDLGILPTII